MTDRARNVLLLGTDYGLFLVGLAFASQATILPAFAAWLGAPNVVIGAIPAVMTLGWFLPSLFAAGHTEALPRQWPFIMRWTGWERVPYLVMALCAFFVAERAPALTLAIVLTMLALSTGIGGLLMPSWMDLIGRAVPTVMRGRFFALSSLAAGVVGFGASVIVADVLARVPRSRSSASRTAGSRASRCRWARTSRACPGSCGAIGTCPGSSPPAHSPSPA